MKKTDIVVFSIATFTQIKDLVVVECIKDFTGNILPKPGNRKYFKVLENKIEYCHDSQLAKKLMTEHGTDLFAAKNGSEFMIYDLEKKVFKAA
jgi:hypothetical protein